MERAKILHVTVAQNDEVRQILDSVGESDRFEVHQVTFRDFTAVDWRSLRTYRAVVFGISDGYCGHCEASSSSWVAPLTRFVSEGGGLLWTHDTLAGLPDLVEISGFRGGSGSNRVPMTVDSVRILASDHQALQWPYQTGLQSRILKKGAHTTGTYSHPPVALDATSARILIDHNIQPSGAHNYYLTVHSHGAGRVALLEVGHAETERFALFEKQLLVNVLCWVCALAPPSGRADQKRDPVVYTMRFTERLVLSASLSIATGALLLHFIDRRRLLEAGINFGISVAAGLLVWFMTSERAPGDD